MWCACQGKEWFARYKVSKGSVRRGYSKFDKPIHSRRKTCGKTCCRLRHGFLRCMQNVGGTSAEVLKGSVVGNNERLFSCSIIEDAKRPNDTFAMVFSGSHVIMDGHTYYKLLAMLCDGAEVLSLSPTRKQQIKEQSAQAMGSEESKFANGMGFCVTSLGDFMW